MTQHNNIVIVVAEKSTSGAIGGASVNLPNWCDIAPTAPGEYCDPEKVISVVVSEYRVQQSATECNRVQHIAT